MATAQDPETEAILKALREQRTDKLMSKLRIGAIVTIVAVAILVVLRTLDVTAFRTGAAVLLGAVVVMSAYARLSAADRSGGVPLAMGVIAAAAALISAIVAVRWSLGYLDVLASVGGGTGLLVIAMTTWQAARTRWDSTDVSTVLGAGAIVSLACGYLFGWAWAAVPLGVVVAALLIANVTTRSLQGLSRTRLSGVLTMLLVAVAIVPVIEEILALNNALARTPRLPVGQTWQVALTDGGLLSFSLLCLATLLGLGTIAVGTYFLRIAYHNLRSLGRSPAPSIWGVAGAIRIPRFAEVAFALREVADQKGLPRGVLEEALAKVQSRLTAGSGAEDALPAVYDALVREYGIRADIAEELVREVQRRIPVAPPR